MEASRVGLLRKKSFIEDNKYWDYARAGDVDKISAYFQAQGYQFIDSKDAEGNTFLHLACAFGNFNLAKWLISHGADVNLQNNALLTPLHWAAMNGYETICSLLLQNGANHSLLTHNKKSAIQLACQNGQVGTCHLLSCQEVMDPVVINELINITPTAKRELFTAILNSNLRKYLAQHLA